jgi:RNA 2',3'-cyclic 3'-phosphodiesterase
VRLFVALDLPAAIREALRGPIAALQPLARNARWVRPEGMHVTLKFIGHVDANGLDAIRAALATVRSDAPIEVRARGLGFFPDARHPRVLWCGIEASPNLAPLAADSERALEALGIAREERKFTPHLTLARLKDPHGIDELVRAAEEMKSRDFGSARETEFCLFESVTKPSGSEYRKVETYPFVKGAA